MWRFGLLFWQLRVLAFVTKRCYNSELVAYDGFTARCVDKLLQI